ncbi:MAG: glucosyl-3-phosphoglycerate synthase [Candidatus Bathyarchaeota archaeon]|nr:glucosyl-3-phosphoglycerate synthase [Candidatus Bathyarchaeota archaeon]
MEFDQEKITRIHEVCTDFNAMEAKLEDLKSVHPCGVIIPVLGDAFRKPTFGKIIEGLNECQYLKKVFIALSTVNDGDYDRAMQMSHKFEVPCEIVWCNKPEVEVILKGLKSKGLDVTISKGKGKDLWIATGIASLDLHAFALHDADIVTYSGSIPTKLLYSIVEPRLDFSFAKGYYARINLDKKKMYGRVCRLFISPIIDALQKKLGHRSDFLRYLKSFSYALSGEIAIYSDLALNLRIPGGWGLEMGMLAELYRNVSTKRICEVDLGFFDHYHKRVSQGSLIKTAQDCFITLLRTLTETEGIDISEPFLLSLQVTYLRFAQDRIRQYNADAICNGLHFDRHEEESSVEALSQVIMDAGRQYMSTPTSAQLPDWLRTISAMPDAREQLRDAAIEK